MTHLENIPHIPRHQLQPEQIEATVFPVPSREELSRRISDRVAQQRQEQLYPLLAEDPTAQVLLKLAGIGTPEG